jgi:glycerol-3-phosphate dehydrogenase
VILGDATGIEALGPHFGADLYGREVDYLVANEWARTAQDVLWRRTKVGLRVGPEDVAALEAYLAH